MKLPKIPIDYSKAGTGEAPFDGEVYILHCHASLNYCLLWDRDNEAWREEGVWDELHSLEYMTHYTPMPEFEEVQESKSTLLQDTYFSGIEFPEIAKGGE